MSDMSFKQAKEITERLELSEITLKSSLVNIEKVTYNFDNLLDKYESINIELEKKDSKITNLKILIGINTGFIIGLLVSKYFL
jgi:hypothetical protein